MRNDLTDITVVLDRSGSMSVCKTDAEGGLNEFIKRQQEQPGDAAFTLVQFDHLYEVVYRAAPIRAVTLHQTLVPRGNTALLDAVGRAIVETGQRLAAVPEHERPGLVVFVIITDGQENASREYSKAKIKEMISHQQDKYRWQFTFLGANQDAFAEALALGIRGGVATYDAEIKTCGTFALASNNVTRMRHAAATGKSIDNSYTPEELQSVS